ncbi:MAG: class I SAM-dependent methyltransferase [Alphaproteobacteria bacterium]|nr:class I SAM-dependent methyltransferase [Alphaproteobacteria bacterium]
MSATEQANPPADPPANPMDKLWDYMKGFHAVHHMAMGVEMDLFKKIHEAGNDGCSPAKLAAGLELHPLYVDVWCRTGYHYGILEAGENGAFCLAEMMDAALVNTSDPRNLAGYLRATVSYGSDDLRSYPEYFRSGGAHRFQEHGEEFSRHVGDATAGFHTVLAKRMLGGVPGLADKLEAGGKVLDVGCGIGGLMIKVAQAWPNAHCVGVDIDPFGINQAQANIAASDVADRLVVEAVGPDGIGHDGEFDLAIMMEVLHEIDDGIRPDVVRDVAKSLKPGGMLFILDETYPSDLAGLRDPSYNFAVQTQFNELIWGNIVPTIEMQTELFANAGLVETIRQDVGGMFTMLVATKE